MGQNQLKRVLFKKVLDRRKSAWQTGGNPRRKSPLAEK